MINITNNNLNNPNDGNLGNVIGNILSGLGVGGGGGGPAGPTFVNNLANQQLNQVIQDSIEQFMESGMASEGTPAAQQFLSRLRTIRGSDLVDLKDCQVCFEKFVDDDKILKLPCKHLYHKDCIEPWFRTHNTCPVCRQEMPSE